MKFKTNLSLAAASVITGTILLSGCGGSDSTAVVTSTTTLTNSTVSGSVTASKFQYAKVYLDLDGSGDYSSGDSEFACTDKEGKFTLDYPVDENTSYIVIAEDQNGTDCDGETIRWITDNTNDTNLTNFMMFMNYDSSKKTADVNPTTFINYLNQMNEGNLTISSGDTNATLFSNLINGKKVDFKHILGNIKLANDIKNKSSLLDTSKTDLELDDNSTIKFDNSDKTSEDLAQLGLYQEQTTPAKIGNLVVSKPLNTIGKLSDMTSIDANDTTVEEGATAVNLDDNGSTSNNFILKKPIFAVINDNTNKVKLVTWKQAKYH